MALNWNSFRFDGKCVADEKDLSEILNDGPKSKKFRDLIVWITHEIKVLANIEEKVDSKLFSVVVNRFPFSSKFSRFLLICFYNFSQRTNSILMLMVLFLIVVGQQRWRNQRFYDWAVWISEGNVVSFSIVHFGSRISTTSVDGIEIYPSRLFADRINGHENGTQIEAERGGCNRSGKNCD